MNAPTMSCEDAIRLIATYIDRELNESEAHSVRDHIERCRSCYSRVEFELKLKAQLATLRSAAVSPELNQRVRMLLQDFGNA